MAWTKEPAIEGKHGGCLNCGPRPDTFAPDMRIGVGFGMAALTRDGAYVAGEEPGQEWDDLMTGAQAEALAAADPDHDWRIQLEGPLSGRTYQRHDTGLWVLIAQNQGFLPDAVEFLSAAQAPPASGRIGLAIRELEYCVAGNGGKVSCQGRAARALIHLRQAPPASDPPGLREALTRLRSRVEAIRAEATREKRRHDFDIGWQLSRLADEIAALAALPASPQAKED